MTKTSDPPGGRRERSGLSRRNLLQGTGGLVAAMALPLPTIARAQPTAAAKEVLVLGAGMSGLTAALALQRRGHKVTVIEYQHRVGGRLLSLPLKNGQFSEAGGGHFRSNQPLVLNYIRRFKLPLLSLNDGLPRYLIDGKTAAAANLTDRPWALAPGERNATLTSTFNRYFADVGLNTYTVLDASWPDPDTLARLDGITGRALIQNVGASDAFCKLVDVPTRV